MYHLPALWTWNCRPAWLQAITSSWRDAPFAHALGANQQNPLLLSAPAEGWRPDSGRCSPALSTFLFIRSSTWRICFSGMGYSCSNGMICSVKVPLSWQTKFDIPRLSVDMSASASTGLYFFLEPQSHYSRLQVGPHLQFI